MVNTIVVFLHRPKKIRHSWITKFNKLEALKPDATQFGSQYIMLRRYVDINNNLRQFFVSNDWEELGLDKKPGVVKMKEFVNDRDMR